MVKRACHKVHKYMSDTLLELKMATQTYHDKLETVSHAKDVLSGTLTLAEYESLIYNNFYIYQYIDPLLNQQLARFCNDEFNLQSHRSHDLKKDLAILKLNCPTNLSFPNITFNQISKHQLIGYLYVLEGARLGGQIVAKALKKNKNLSHLPEFYFYTQSNVNVRDRWLTFRNIANTELSINHLTEAIQSAQTMFQFFIDVFQTHHQELIEN